MKKLRACPICPICNSKKFERLEGKGTKVRCLKCKNEMVI